MKAIIEFDHVTVKYGQTEAVSDISCVIEKGDFVGLAGPNGAGKTTLIKALFGLIPVTAGKISLFGQAQKSFTDWQKIGYLPQKLTNLNPLFPASVREVVLLGLLSSKKPPKIITEIDNNKVGKVLGELEITLLKDKMLAELSGGQQQRVMLARALAAEPEILIFDEPSTALDPQSRKNFFRLIKKLNQEKGVTVIIITHDTGYIGNYANKLLYIDRKLVHFGKLADFCPAEKAGPYFEKSDGHIIWHQHK